MGRTAFGVSAKKAYTAPTRTMLDSLPSIVSPSMAPADAYHHRLAVWIYRARQYSARVENSTIGPSRRTCLVTMTW